MQEDYYTSWEWQPIERMPNGCSEVILRDNKGNTTEMCSCDYWWLDKNKKKLYTSFRFV